MDTRTITDWMSHASAATDPAERARCVSAAMAQARSCFDWRIVLNALVPLEPARDLLADIARETLERAVTSGEVWGFRDVAAARAGSLGDRHGAREALARGAAAFGTRAETRAYEWVLLADGFAEVLGDEGGARACLASAVAAARAEGSASALADTAVAVAKRLDRAAGIALLREAEALDADTRAGAWNVANAWRALGVSTEAARVLEEATARCATLEGALKIARAWSSHENPGGAARALRRAEELAHTAAGWLALAETALDARQPESAVRAALARAESVVDEETRPRIAAAYQRWLRDEPAAQRLGPRGVRPEALRPIVRALAGWIPSASALLDWLRARVTHAQRSAIAAADYGADERKHFAALEDLCRTGLVPRSLAWHPGEVLELTRWSAGEGVDHHVRALCCTLLCIAPDGTQELAINGPLLVESVLALGPEASALAEQFLAWRYIADGAGDDAAAPVALALLGVLRAAENPGDPRIAALVQRLVTLPAEDTPGLAETVAASQCAATWRALSDRVLAPARAAHPPVAALLEHLGFFT